MSSVGGPPPRPPAARALADLAVLLGGTLLAAVHTGLWRDLGRRFFAGPDPIIDLWTLDWVSTHLLRAPARVFEGNIFYPAHDTVLLSDALVGPALLVQPLRLLSTNPVLLYNAAVILGLALASWGFFRLGLALYDGDRLAALLPAVAVPYCAQQVHHLTHLNLLVIAGFPFLWLAVLRLLERPGPLPAAGAAVAFAFQAATSGYQAVACALLSLTLAAWGFRRFREPRTWLWAGAAGLLAALLLMPYLVAFFRLSDITEMARTVAQNQTHSLSLPRDLVRTQAYAWSWLLLPRGDSAFPGLVVGGLAAVALVRGRAQARVRMLALVAAVFFVLALGPALQAGGRTLFTLPYAWLMQVVPVLKAGRHPSTFVIVSLMALGLLAGAGLRLSGLSRRPALAMLVLGLAVAESLAPTPPRDDLGDRLPAAYAWLSGARAEAILELPFDDPAQQWWAAWRHDVPTTNGISPFAPARSMELAQRVWREWRAVPAADLEDATSVAFLKRHFPVSHLVLHPDVPREVVANVEATPRTFERVEVTADGARIYRVHRGGAGTVLRRAFRDDVLRARAVRVTARASSAGAQAIAALGKAEIDRWPLGPEWTAHDLRVPAALLRRGANDLVLARADGGVVEVRDVEALP